MAMSARTLLSAELGADFIRGGADNDLLAGGKGQDILFGDLGRDVFDFNIAAESKVGALRDVIKDFRHAQHDRIDLRDIDANMHLGGNQAFHLIGAHAFTHAAGEIRFAGGVLAGDTDGNGVANFEIRVIGLAAPVAGDFFL